MQSKNNNILLEIVCYSLESCINAKKAGADRIELCGGFLEGGTTPSFGLIKKVLENVDIPVYVMIRPRGGDFHYSESELEVMMEDVIQIKKLKPAGFVIGCLTIDGEVNEKVLKNFMKEFEGFGATFHRAIDVCRNPKLSIETLISLGFESILTSGQANKSIEGLEMLTKMNKWAADRINIMAGSGVNINNVSELLKTGVNAVHFSAIVEIESKMNYQSPNVKMGGENIDEFTNYEADYTKIIEMRALLENYIKSNSMGV